MPLTVDQPEPAYTYVRSEIASEGLAKARYELGDTGVAKDSSNSPVWLLADDEIAAMIGLPASIEGISEPPTRYALGVAELAEGLAARFAQSPDTYTDPAGKRVEWKARVAQWNALAARKRSDAGAVTANLGGGARFGVMAAPPLTDPTAPRYPTIFGTYR